MTILQAAVDRGRSARERREYEATLVEITMTATPNLVAFIEQLGRDSGQPMERVIEQALALYRVALTAHHEGKHIGLAASPDALDVEFTGFPEN